MTVVVEAVGLTKTYEGGRLCPLNGVDLAIGPGESVSITGPSGSGKSTLLNLVSLIDRADSGSLALFGNDISSVLNDGVLTRFRGSNLGFVFQDALVDPRRTVLENVLIGLRHARIPRGERRRSAERSLLRVGLGERFDAKARVLSGGERQRLAIARAVAHAPKLLLCDEPTGNLDESNTDVVWDVLASLQANGTTVLVVTHDLALAARCQRTAHLDNGQLDWQ